jgi:type 1 glutamine amidotransferase
MYWPKVERGSWDVPEYRQLLARSVAWAAYGDAATAEDR